MYCPNCASQIPTDVKFCARCGTNLTTVSDLLNGRILEPPQSEELNKLIAKCHSGYLATVVGFALVITSLLIAIAAMMFGVMPAAISGLIFLGWAIPAFAQGMSKWVSAKREMRSILEGTQRGTTDDDHPQNRLPARKAVADSHRVASSVTEQTTAGLDQYRGHA